MSGKLPDVTDATFQAEVLDSEGAVLIRTVRAQELDRKHQDGGKHSNACHGL